MKRNTPAFLLIAGLAMALAACNESTTSGRQDEILSSSEPAISSSLTTSSSSATDGNSSTDNGNSSAALLEGRNCVYSASDSTLTCPEQTYKTIVIGTQTWMAQNLNYDTLDGEGSWCLDNSEANCDQYGRLYNWATAMNISQAFNKSSWSGNETNHQGLCPDHWRIPTDADWDTLISYATGYDSAAAPKLRAVDGWDKASVRNVTGTDKYGFAALPAGDFCSQNFDWQGALTGWYSASGGLRVIDNHQKVVIEYNSNSTYKGCAYSIRCIYGDSPTAEEDSSSDTTASAAEKWCLVPGNCGIFFDDRDSIDYLWTKIGSQIWMSENLRYRPTSRSYSGCFYSSCVDGYRYRWQDAMDGADSTNAVPSGVQGLCPDGWHLPSGAEWDTLARFVDENNGTEGVGYSLKSTDYWDTYQDADGGGRDAFAFTALGAGEDYGAFMYVGSYTWFLTASKTVRRLSYSSGSLGESLYGNSSEYFSVRCVKD